MKLLFIYKNKLENKKWVVLDFSLQIDYVKIFVYYIILK